MKKIAFKSENNHIHSFSPTRLIVSSFAAVILVGSFLLWLPISSKEGQTASYLDALFTATSATCVTGLVVKDTLTQWSLFGQLVILSLIQIGGLGLITLATSFSVFLKKRIGLKGMVLAQESISYFSFAGVLKLVKRIVIITFAIELTGALLLSISFVPKFGPRGFYLGIFHAVSAFCNAGFDIMGNYNNLIGYNDDPIVIYTVAGLIIIGGLGFLVWKDLYDYRKEKSLYLHTKIVLFMTALLLISGTAFIFLGEYNNPATMGGFSLFEKFNAAFFQSTAARTAGFSSIPLGLMTDFSKAISIILMFIGAAPGSTGGGIKVTTFSVVALAVISQIRGSNETIIFKRRVHYSTVIKALAIISLGIMIVVTGTLLLLAFGETNPAIDLVYEMTSAFATVGNSTAFTPSLLSSSKVVLIIAMFLGRVGPLSFGIALSLKNNNSSAETIYPEGKLIVG